MSGSFFNESNSSVKETELPNIFDVLEGGEDEGTVKYLLGFSTDGSNDNLDLISSPILPQIQITSDPSATRETSVSETPLTKEGKPRKREPVDPTKCIYPCFSCSKSFTTKFNLKRHINLHCNKSKEAGVPTQGPPSASRPSRKSKEKREAAVDSSSESSNMAAKKLPSRGKIKKQLGRIQPKVEVPVVAAPSTNVRLLHPVVSQPLPIAQPSSTAQSVASPTFTTCSTGVSHGIVVQNQSLPVVRPPQQGERFIPHRIVRIVHPPGDRAKLQTTAFVGHFSQRPAGTIPLLQTTGNPRVIQAVPVSIVPQTVHLAQKPLPMFRTLRPVASQYKPLSPVLSSPPVSNASLYPTYVQTANYVETALADSSHTRASTVTYSVPSTLTTDTTILSKLPEELFESEEVPTHGSVNSTTQETTTFMKVEPEAENISSTNCKAGVVTSTNSEADGDDKGSLNLPTNPPRGVLQQIPHGWIRKLVETNRGRRVFYYNKMGKKFSTMDEINQYFSRLGQSVQPGLFDFDALTKS